MTPAGRLLIWRAAALPDVAAAARARSCARSPGAIAIATGAGALLPMEVQPDNRRAMAWGDFLRGARLGTGARISELR